MCHYKSRNWPIRQKRLLQTAAVDELKVVQKWRRNSTEWFFIVMVSVQVWNTLENLALFPFGSDPLLFSVSRAFLVYLFLWTIQLFFFFLIFFKGGGNLLLSLNEMWSTTTNCSKQNHLVVVLSLLWKWNKKKTVKSEDQSECSIWDDGVSGSVSCRSS